MERLLAEIKAHQERMKALMDVNPEKMKTWLHKMEAYLEKSEASQEKTEDVMEGYEEAP
jgi:flagellar motility protein MotE (MotC chaperone)